MKNFTNNGAVKVAIISPTRIVLIQDPSRSQPLWSLPGGCIEDGETVYDAAVSEVKEETGITLSRVDLTVVYDERRDGRYVPYLCVATVSEEVIDSRAKVGDENGQRLLVAAFTRDEAPEMVDLLNLYRPFIREMCGRQAA